MRRVLVLVLACALLAVAATPTLALTVQRTWKTAFGTSAAYGRASLVAYTDGTGTISVGVKSLRKNATYRPEIRAGHCSSLGTLLARAGGFTTDATGAAKTTLPLTLSQMNSVWSVAHKGAIAMRIVSGTSIKCGNLTFAKSTRIRIPAYSIDLPVVPGPSTYPYCNVAMYQKILYQPQEPGVTFIYAHARKGMFLPLLNASKIDNGAAMIGKLVYVYTSNSRVHTYKITKVIRHVSTMPNPFAVTDERLWLQTSEGPNFTYPKLLIYAVRVATATTSYAASHPTPHIVHCS